MMATSAGNRKILTTLIICFMSVFVGVQMVKPKTDLIQRITDLKEFKKFVRTHTNVLVLFARAERDVGSDSWQVCADVATEMKGTASIVFIDCSLDKKFCKKLKSSTESFELKHYKDGEFHKVYDRKLTIKSLINFLKDPKGEIPWEEDSTALDVVHLDTQAVLMRILSKESRPLLVMFYAPWCHFCKKLKPEFAAAATHLKEEAILAGMDADRPENTMVRSEFNVTGFPTLVYFEKGQKKFLYTGEMTKDAIIQWMKNPTPPKAPEEEEQWSEVASDVVHLTDSTFEEFIASNPSVLVMFYAPWCVHCKKMKPEYVVAAAQLKEENIEGTLAAVDAQKETKTGERFKVKGFPTVKYFKNGTETWDIHERTSDKIVDFMKNPQEPVPPPAETAWEDTPSFVEHLNEEVFKSFIKKKKHTLVMFYAPWCGHCKKAKPEFMNAAEQFKDDTKVAFAAIDCTKQTILCGANDVSGYPTFKYFNYGKNDIKYTGGREENDFVAFMKNPLNPLSSSPSKSEAGWTDFEGHENVLHLTDAIFNSVLQEEYSLLVMFYTPWCPHCSNMKEAYVQAATVLEQANVDGVLAAVDCTAETALRTRFDIKGYPTLRYFRNGQEAFEYEFGRTTQELVNFMKNPVPPVDDLNWISDSGDVNHLTSSNFTSFLVRKKVFVMFYAPWCPHCKAAKPIFWEMATNVVNDESDLVFASLDCTDATNRDVCLGKSISVYPMFKYFDNGAFVADYTGDRSSEDLLKFINNLPEPKEEL